MSGNKTQEQEIIAFKEERDFFRSIGMTDPQIAERLGIDWDSYRTKIRRHPELGAIYDPRDREREWVAGWTNILRNRKGATA